MNDNLEISEFKKQELDECLAFRNSIFTPVDIEQWKAMNCTAVVARDDRGLAGFIPLQFRDQLIRPGVAVPVVYENAVGVAEDRRGTGIGTRMMEAAADFISDRADALLVVRGGERTPGYRFYRRTGHSDLCYATEYLLPADATVPQDGGCGVTEVDRETWLASENALLQMHHDRYSGFAGGRPRAPGYWKMILDSHVFKNRGWKSLLAGDGGAITGYLTGIFGTWQHKEDLCVFEAVARDKKTMGALIQAAKKLSISGAVRFPALALANPIRQDIEALGFTASETSPHLMARLLRPDRIFKRLSADTDLETKLSLTVMTPHRTLVVNEAADAGYKVRLELKEHDLARLFLCRLDLHAALELETVRCLDLDAGIRRELNELFRPADWVQWFTDYV